MIKIAHTQEKKRGNRASGQPVRDSFPAGVQKTTTTPVKWLRMEAAASYSGMSRSTLYQAMEDGQLKSVLVRQTGRIKGIRLISLESLEAYINSFGEKDGAFVPGFSQHPKTASKS